MSFSDYPFTPHKDGDQSNFPGHEEVLKFLKGFARDFELIDLIRFNTEVIGVELVKKSKDDKWVVESRTRDHLSSEEVFDAVVICSGYHTQPRLAELAGIEKWPGKQIHSHNYRVPEPFRDQVVVVIGFGPSALDIALEVAMEAKEVHICCRYPGIQPPNLDTHSNLWLHSQVKCCFENGEIAFEDGGSITADVIFHCTGYNYSFPFLKTNGIVSIDDNRVGPLYKHVFPPQLAPRLSFPGIPRRGLSFIQNELQGKWIAQAISGKVHLPPEEEMLADVQQHYRLMEQNGVPKRHTHTLPLNVGEYLDFLSGQVGQPPVGKQPAELFMNILKRAFRSPWDAIRNPRTHTTSCDICDVIIP